MSTTERLIYLPLGGAGEIGMNAYVYGYGEAGREKLIVVDLGVTFPDMGSTPGVDLIFPDISWLEARRHDIEGIFITHAHEDHVGAIGHLWDKLGAPIYARSFTSHIARRKMADQGHPEALVKTAEAWPSQIEIGAFQVTFIPISHSIPESSGLLISTPAGRIIHTGDFKMDETPMVGEAFDPALWEEVSKDGVKALVCDSTNVFSEHAGRSEASLGKNIEALVASAPEMVVATTFASNVARVKTLAEAGVRAGRSICLMGRAMRTMIEASIETGVLKDFPPVVTPEDAKSIPRAHLMLLATGSQGERRAATAQLAHGKFQGMELREGDLFLFSSKTIPGNEKDVIRIINQLSEKGVDVVDDSNGTYHVSGHANRPDLQRMHEITKPQCIIPMHGEHRHLRAHQKLAEASGHASVVCVNGMMLDLSGNAPKVVEYVETGRVYLDGTVQYGALDGIMRERIKMAMNGLVHVNIVMDDEDDFFAEPWVEIRGLPTTGRSHGALEDILEEDVSQFLGRAKQKTRQDDDALEDEVRKIVRQTTLSELGKKPEVSVTISRLV